MTEADYRDALRLLDSATSLLQNSTTVPPGELLREVRALSWEFDFLRLRLGQPAPALQRN
jgi:hypothetical protein